MKKVVTVCPYCASGCKINLVVDNGKIVRAEAAQGKTNQGTLCLKGYYGWDFINDTQIDRKDGHPWFKTLRGRGYLMVSAS